MLELLVNIVKPSAVSLWIDLLLLRGASAPTVNGGYSLQVLDGGSEVVRAIGHQLLIRFFDTHKAVFAVR